MHRPPFSTYAVTPVVKRYAAPDWLDANKYARHSLTGGLATAKAVSGACGWTAQSDHKQEICCAIMRRDESPCVRIERWKRKRGLCSTK